MMMPPSDGITTVQDKLPRGSFYYVRLGPRFYAGEVVNFKLIQTNIPKWQWGSAPKVEPEYRKEFTGGSKAQITDDFSKAKKFRRKTQAQRVCESLDRYYSGSGIKTTLELHKGDTSEHPRKAERKNPRTS
jgi:hypothetical protein